MDSMFYKIYFPSDEIKIDDWVKIVDSRPDLTPIPDKVMTNPFTQEDVKFPGEGKAYFMKGESIEGNISLEEGVLLTMGVPKSICSEIALKLGAKLIETDLS